MEYAPTYPLAKEAQREADALKQPVAVYQKSSGEHYLVRNAHEVLPGTRHVFVCSPKTPTRCPTCGK